MGEGKITPSCFGMLQTWNQGLKRELECELALANVYGITDQ